MQTLTGRSTNLLSAWAVAFRSGRTMPESMTTQVLTEEAARGLWLPAWHFGY